MPDYTIRLDGLEVTMGLGIHRTPSAPPRSASRSCRDDLPLSPPRRKTGSTPWSIMTSFAPDPRARRLAPFRAAGNAVRQVAALALRDPRVAEVRVRSMKLDIYPDARIGCEIVRRRIIDAKLRSCHAGLKRR
jgi:dihydroneopterin aldolase